MSTEQKLCEAIKRLLKANRITIQAPPKTITDAENQLREIENAVKYAEEALATTEPEPTGIPELPEPVANVSASSPVGGIGFVKPDKSYFTEDQMLTYGEQCWKAGYKHGAWGGDAKDAERYRWLADSNNYYEAIDLISDGSLTEDALGKVIDAAMAKGVKG